VVPTGALSRGSTRNRAAVGKIHSRQDGDAKADPAGRRRSLYRRKHVDIGKNYRTAQDIRGYERARPAKGFPQILNVAGPRCSLAGMCFPIEAWS